MAGPRCSTHTDTDARASACSRCGDFACEDCFGDPLSTLCPPCQEAEGFHPSDLRLPERQQRQRRWMRKNPRAMAVLVIAIGMFLAGMNLILIATTGYYRVFLFPMAGMGIGIGLTTLVTGRVAPDHRGPPTARERAIAGLFVLGGLGIGFLINALV